MSALIHDDEVPVVDDCVIDALLALTPEQRLLRHDRMLRIVHDLIHDLAAHLAHGAAVQRGHGD